MLCRILIAYFSTCWRRLSDTNATRSRQKLISFSISIFFHALRCRSIFRFISSMILIDIDIWSDDWLSFDLIMQCTSLFCTSSIIDIFRRKMILSLCKNLKIIIRIISKLESRINRVILVDRLNIISTNSIVSISIKMKEFLFDRDYLFQSISREWNLEFTKEIMTHIINVDLVAVQICNFSNKSVVVSRRARLDRLIEYEEHECYSTNAFEISLTTDSFWNISNLLIELIWRKTVVIINIRIEIKNVITTDRSNAQTNMNEKSFNDKIAYELFKVRKQLFFTINQYSAFWD